MRFFFTRLFDFIAIALLVLTTTAFWKFPTIVTSLADMRSTLLTAFGMFLAGPIWGVYGRLSSLDKLDGLNADRRGQINSFADVIRKNLLKIFLSGGLCLVFAIAALILASKADWKVAPDFSWDFAVSLFIVVVSAFFCVFFVYSLVKVVGLLFLVEESRTKVSEWLQKEGARKKVIADLRKLRQDQQAPANDEHLLKYRNVVEIPVDARAKQKEFDQLPQDGNAAVKS